MSRSSVARRRRARAVALAWLMSLAGSPASLVASGDGAEAGGAWSSGAAGVDAAVALAAASEGGCPTWVSCGAGCTADLVTGFCVLSFGWQGGIRIGGVQLGPSIRVECSICECWYIYEGSLGQDLFKRTTNAGCGGSTPGLELIQE